MSTIFDYSIEDIMNDADDMKLLNELINCNILIVKNKSNDQKLVSVYNEIIAGIDIYKKFTIDFVLEFVEKNNIDPNDYRLAYLFLVMLMLSIYIGDKNDYLIYTVFVFLNYDKYKPLVNEIYSKINHRNSNITFFNGSFIMKSDYDETKYSHCEECSETRVETHSEERPDEQIDDEFEEIKAKVKELEALVNDQQD